MGDDLSIPADIFEEMAGMKEITPPPSKSSKENVNKERIVTPINEGRLQEASIAFFSKVKKKFVSRIMKVTKKLLSYQQKDQPPKLKKPKFVHITIIRHESENETAARKSAKKLKKSGGGMLKAAWKALKFIIKQVLKFVIKQIVKRVIKAVIQAFTKMFNFIKKTITRAFKTVIRTIKKIANYLFKGVRKIVKSIWKIVKKLFFRGKPMPKQFKGEPEPKEMKAKPIPKKKNHLKLKMKGMPKKENFIFKAVKKIFNKFSKILMKIISVVFKKIIKKIISVIVKMIIKFVIAQAIGSAVPFIGNVIMGAASVALMVYDVLDMVDFVKGVSNDVQKFAYLAAHEEDEGDEDDEDDGPEIDEMGMEEVQAFMRGLEKEGKTQSDDYYEAKARYLELLAEQYEKEGDKDGAELIQLAMEMGRVPKDLDDIESAENPNAIEELDIEALKRELVERKLKKSESKHQIKPKNIFDDDEIEILLTGEEDGGPMWTSIWREYMLYIKNHIYDRHGIAQYQKIIDDEFKPLIKPIEYNVDINPDWMVETQEQRDNRVSEGEDKILREDNDTGGELNVNELEDKLSFEDVIEKTNELKFDTMKVTYAYRSTKIKEINAQRKKHNNFLTMLTTMLEKRNISSSDLPYRPYNMSLGPTR